MTAPRSQLPSASIVVPTFNRLADLQRVVAEVRRQIESLGGGCELIVVNDGSTDGTRRWLDGLADPPELTVLHQDNAGPARARNRGADAGTGEIVFFLGDDTVPGDGWLREHLETHRMRPEGSEIAALGYTSFPAELDSPFLRWINEHGAQFGYALIDNPLDVPFNFFYTSNISLPMRVFRDLGGFREDFPAAAWEDIEFAYRAVGDRVRLVYLPRARTVHNHRITVGSFCRRQRTSGASAAIFSRLHPELEGFLGVPCIDRVSVRSRLERPLLRMWVAVGELVHGAADDAVYRRLLDACYLEGLAAGLD